MSVCDNVIYCCIQTRKIIYEEKKTIHKKNANIKIIFTSLSDNAVKRTSEGGCCHPLATALQLTSHGLLHYSGKYTIHCVMDYTALQSTLLYALNSAKLCRNALYCTELFCTVLQCALLFCIVLCCTVLYCIVLQCSVV